MKIRLFVLLTIIQPVLSFAADTVLPAEKPTRVLVSSIDSDLSLAFYAPGVVKADFLEGALYWKHKDRVIKLGNQPIDAYPIPQGAYVVYQKLGKLMIGFRALSGEETIYSNEILFQHYGRNAQINLSAQGIQLNQLAEARTRLFSVGTESGVSESLRIDASPAHLAVLKNFGTSLVESAKKGDLQKGLFLTKRYEAFEGRLDPSGKSVCIVGPADMTGRELITELAYRIAQGKVRSELLGWELIEINFASLGTEGKADLGLKKIQEIITASQNKKVILLIDGIHQLIGMGGANNDLLSVLLPAISRKDLYVIATTSEGRDEFGRLDQRNGFSSAFQFVKNRAYDPKTEVPEIVKEKTKQLQASFGFKFPDTLIKRLISETTYRLPEKSHPVSDFAVLDRLQEVIEERNAGKIPPGYEIRSADLKEALDLVSEPIPYENKKLVAGLPKALDEQLVGSAGAKDRISKCFQKAAMGGREDRRPVCIFFALGGSGTGKTFSAELLRDYFKAPYDQWKLENFKEEHTVHTLIGSPDSFVGSGKPGALVEFASKFPTGIMLFDELDKAHPSVIQALDPLLDEGFVKDLSNSSAYFNRGVVVMTSNFGMKEIKEFDEKNPNWREWPKEVLFEEERKLVSTIQDHMLAQNILPSWVIGRIPSNNWLIFHSFNRAENIRLAKILIAKPVKKMEERLGCKIQIDERVYESLAEKYAKSDLGARPIRDAVESTIGPLFYERLEAMRGKDEDVSVEGKTFRFTLASGDGYAIEEVTP